MALTHDFQPSLDYIKAQEKLFVESKSLRRSRSRSSLSEATEILDSEYETDSADATSNSSLYRSSGSLVAESVTTLSSFEDVHVKTPDSTGLNAFHFHIDTSPIKGPQGPHLFRTSEESIRPQLTPDWTLDKPLDSAVATDFYTGFFPEPEQKPTQVEVPYNDVPTPPPSKPSSARPVANFGVASWSPNEVVSWMHGLGFEESVIEKFFINDITGAILLELQIDDLKELEISSFGKRHQLMACIRQLRRSHYSDTPTSCNSGLSTPDTTDRQEILQPIMAGVSANFSSPAMECESERSRSWSRSSNNHHLRDNSRQKRGRNGTDVVPEESVSIVAIEQLLPKLHVCSKGENCRKWQKQQTRVARLLKDLQREGLGGSVLVTGDAAHTTPTQPVMDTPKLESRPSMSAKSPILEAKPFVPDVTSTAPPMFEVKPPMMETTSPSSTTRTPRTDKAPSLVASSDIMGPTSPRDIQLSQESLDGVQSRDPQENVRNFLNFQRLSELQPTTDPATPPLDNDASMEDSSRSVKGNPTLSQHLRGLPKLRIPSMRSESPLSPSYSALRTITPSAAHKSRQFPPVSSQKSPSLYSSMVSPSDFYRHDSKYEQSYPLSSGDQPLTAIPFGPVERGCSQSVPPDMRFGNQPQARPPSATTESRRRLHSAVNQQNFRPLVPVAERSPLPPIETPDDLEQTPKAGHCRNNPFGPGSIHANDIIHSGQMKKRKTTKLIRHAWEENHFTLRGTHLCMYPDQQAAIRDYKALERIDVDDYAVACSSLHSTTKLTAAFKRTVLKRVNDPRGETAFAFSLIPASNSSGSGFERRAFGIGGPKSHHFAVNTREERIDWMRELMLAKALRRGRESGESVNVNGEPF